KKRRMDRRTGLNLVKRGVTFGSILRPHIYRCRIYDCEFTISVPVSLNETDPFNLVDNIGFEPTTSSSRLLSGRSAPIQFGGQYRIRTDHLFIPTFVGTKRSRLFGGEYRIRTDHLFIPTFVGTKRS